MHAYSVDLQNEKEIKRLVATRPKLPRDSYVRKRQGSLCLQ
jgi:hypothetical protein